jgi:hypothetical protein
VDTNSRQDNAATQKLEPGSASVGAGTALAAQLRGLGRQMAGHALIEPVLELCGQKQDFCGHVSFSAKFSWLSPRVFTVAETVIMIEVTDFNICQSINRD